MDTNLLTDEEMRDRIASIRADLELIQTAVEGHIDGGCCLFVLPDGRQVSEMCGYDALIAICLLLGIDKLYQE